MQRHLRNHESCTLTKFATYLTLRLGFFVTFRWYGSVSKSKISELKKKYHIKINVAKTLKDLHQRNFEIFNL